MKKVLFVALAFVAGFAVPAHNAAAKVVKISADRYDFGKIKQGTPVSTYFDITNISTQPVVVESATAGCGCTTPEVSKEPIAPNASTKLKVGYNAAAMGHFDKPVTIKLAGVPEVKQVIISGEVVDAASYDAFTKTDEYKATLAKQEVKATAPADVKTVVKEKQTSTKSKKKVKSTSSK